MADPGGGGGSRGSGPPPLGHDVGFLTLGPKLDTPPPFFACRPKMQWPPPPPWNVDDVTRAMSKGGCLWMSKSGGVFQFFGGRMTSHGQCPRGGGACECLHPPLSGNPVSAPEMDPPPFKYPGSAPAGGCFIASRLIPPPPMQTHQYRCVGLIELSVPFKGGLGPIPCAYTKSDET